MELSLDSHCTSGEASAWLSKTLNRRLQEICIQVVANKFEELPDFGKLSIKYIKRVTELLTLDLPLELAGTVSPCLFPAFLLPLPLPQAHTGTQESTAPFRSVFSFP